MKKILLGVVLVLSFVLLPSKVYASDTVTVYIFRGETCSHCEEALTYINEHKEEINENIKIATYEVWNNANNGTLQNTVAQKLGVDINGDNYGVPFIVIGEEYIQGYAGVSTYNKIIETAEAYIDNEEYKDVVEQTANELKEEDSNISFEQKGLSDIFSEPNKLVTIIVYTVFGVIVLGFIAMMVFSRK